MLEILNKFNFHDAILISIDVNFEKRSINIFFKEDFESDIIELKFRSINNLNIDNLCDYDDFEIHEAKFSLSEDKYIANFIILLGFGKPSWEIEFSFDKVIINPIKV